MAEEKKVKVKAITLIQSDNQVSLWGVVFDNDGKDFVASLPKSDADAMVEAGRVTII